MSIFKKVAKTVTKKVIKPAIRKSGVSPYVKAGAHVATLPVRGFRDTTRAIRGSKSSPRNRRR